MTSSPFLFDRYLLLPSLKHASITNQSNFVDAISRRGINVDAISQRGINNEEFIVTEKAS